MHADELRKIFKARRRELKVAQWEVSRLLNKPQSFMAKLELGTDGRPFITIDHFMDICNILELDPVEVITKLKNTRDKMIFALDNRNRELVEFNSISEMKSANVGQDDHYSLMSTEAAHKWVTDGRTHNTGLFINMDGKVEYAEAQGD